MCTADLQWVSDSYIIPVAAMILSAGVFGDLHGRRRVYLIGMALTVLGSVIAALAGTLSGMSALHLLWTGQAVTGAGAGLLLPTTLALIAHAVPDLRARARYVALWATGLVLGIAVGPLMSGTILRYVGWGWVFVPNAGSPSSPVSSPHCAYRNQRRLPAATWTGPARSPRRSRSPPASSV
jgi:MFS family permease